MDTKKSLLTEGVSILSHQSTERTKLYGFADVIRRPEEVIDRVMARTREFFAARTDHHPSDAMIEAMADIPRTVFTIARGKAAEAYYLSRLDCGVGKTTTLRFTMQAMQKWFSVLGHPGIVLCLGRRDEIEKMIVSMDLRESDYAVLVAKDVNTNPHGPFNGIPYSDLGVGQGNINSAPVLLTTHAMVESRLSRKTWAEAQDFYFRDRRRLLRIWDEAVFVRKGITVDRNTLLKIAGSIESFREQIETFLETMGAAEDGSILTVPDFQGQCEIQTVWDWLKPNERSFLADSLKDLWFMSGRPVLVRSDRGKEVLITYQTRLPDDIKPMLVLDASARVRATYQQQDRKDGDIVWLADCDKKYQNLTIHFEAAGSGKGALGDDWHQRVEQVAEIIRRHPDRKALVLHHMQDKAKGVGNFEAAVQAALQSDGLKAETRYHDVAFLHWGVHNAVNDFADRNLIITASIFRAPLPATEALGRAAADRPVKEEYSAEELQELRHGEVLHDLLQGLSRGCLRNLDGDQAKECLIYLRASKNSRVREDLDRLFPGCQVVDGWELEADHRDRQQFTNKELEILEFVSWHFRSGADSLSFPEIYNGIPMQQQNFSRCMKNKELQREIEGMGLVIEPGRGRKPNLIVRAENSPSAIVNHDATAVTAIPHRSRDFSWRRASNDARGMPVEKLPHSCGSSDALQVFAQMDGSFDGYCFACDTFVRDPYHDKPEGYEPKVRVPSKEDIEEKMALAASCPVKALPDRRLRAESLGHFGVTIGVSEQDGVTPTLQHYPYTADGQVKAYKVRLISPKKIWVIGVMRGVNMFGWPQALESSSSTLYITEGELDAVSLWQVFQDNGEDAAIVSLSRGASGVRRDLEQHRTAIADRFDDVVLVFDQDKAGYNAVMNAQAILPNARAIELPEKDANACLIAGKAQALYEAAVGALGILLATAAD